MLRVKSAVKKYRSIPVAIGAVSAAMAFPVFAKGGIPTVDLDSLLAMFPMVTAWFWKECGLLLVWILGQSILLAAMCLFFADAVVAFFMRIYHQV